MNNSRIEVDKMRCCIDNYMVKTGKSEIDEKEANCILERAGLLSDDKRHPGKPLRELLDSLRDTDMLPMNVTYSCGIWHIKHSKTKAIDMQIFQW